MKKIVTALSLVVLFLACNYNKEKEKSNKLVIAQGFDIKTLDPYSATDLYSRRVIANIYDRLVEKNEKLEIIPGLAKSWKIIDEKTIMFKLKNKVKFHSGKELTSKDVKYSLENAKKSHKVGVLYTLIKEIETPDKNTIIIKTEEPFGALLHHLSHISASIVNKDDYENKKIIGTGAYKFIEWKPGDKIRLKRFSGYFKGDASIEEINIKTVPEDTNKVIGLQTEEIDIALDISPMSRINILKDKKLKLYEKNSMGVSFLGLNLKSEKLNNKKLREAIAYSIDKDIIIETILFNSVKSANSLLGSGVFGYSKDSKTLPYNKKKAIKLIDELKYKNRLNLKLVTSNFTTYIQIATVLQAQLKEVGINVDIEILEWGKFLESTGNGEGDLFIMGWSNSSGDADYGLSAMLHSSLIGHGGNRSFFKNKKFDKLLEKGRKELNQEKRQEYYYQAQELMNNEIPVLPLYFSLANAGINKNKIKNYIQSPINIPNLYKIRLKNTYF